MGKLEDLISRSVAVRQDLDKKYGQLEYIQSQRDSTLDEISKLKELAVVYDQVASVLNSMGEQQQLQLQSKIERLVTEGIQTIFAANLSFHIMNTVKGKTPNVEFVIRTTTAMGVVDTPVMDARGGGLVAVVGFLLSLVMLLLKRKEKDSFLFLDESFSFLSEILHPDMSEFLQRVSEKLGVKIVLVTHTPGLAEKADIVYSYKLVNDVTRVTREK